MTLILYQAKQEQYVCGTLFVKPFQPQTNKSAIHRLQCATGRKSPLLILTIYPVIKYLCFNLKYKLQNKEANMTDTVNTVKDVRSYRLSNIDMMRGLVILIMAIDHVRDYFYFAGSGVSINDPTIDAGFYFTRWII